MGYGWLISVLLICLVNPLRYKTQLPRKSILLSLFGCSVCFTIIGIVDASGVGYFPKTFLLYRMIALNLIYILLTVATYIFAFYLVRKSQFNFGNNATGHQRKTIKKIFLVPGIIIRSYLIFYLIPFAYHFVTILKHCHFPVGKEAVLEMQLVITCIGYSIDPMTYVLLCQHYRSAFAESIPLCLHGSDEHTDFNENIEVNYVA